MSAPAANALALPVMTIAPMLASAIERQQRCAQRVHQGIVQRIELVGAVSA